VNVETDNNDDALTRRARREVGSLHIFFEEWFHGRLPATDDAFARFERAMAPEFEMLMPAGTIHPRAPLLAALRDAHGAWRDDPEARIEIRASRARVLTGTAFVLVRYEEWQQIAARWRGRLSSALLRVDIEAPGGFSWWCVHETWLPEAAS
jgi:hypothetical protein